MGYTRHGHHIPGTSFENGGPVRRRLCDGATVCIQCSDEAIRYLVVLYKKEQELIMQQENPFNPVEGSIIPGTFEGDIHTDMPSVDFKPLPEGDRLENGLRFASPRHPSVEHMGPHFAFGHLPPHLQLVAKQFARLGQFLVDSQKDGPELVESLRKLWESKNSAIIHAGFIADRESQKTDQKI